MEMNDCLGNERKILDIYEGKKRNMYTICMERMKKTSKQCSISKKTFFLCWSTSTQIFDFFNFQHNILNK